MRLCDRWIFCFLLVLLLLHTVVAPAQQLHKPLRFITNRDGLPQSFVSDMVQDKDGFVWMGTPNGLARYDGLHIKLFQHNSSDTATLVANTIFRLQIDVQNRIWIFYEKNEIDLFDPVTEKVTHIFSAASIRRYFSSVRFILATHEGALCISSDNGLYICRSNLSGVARVSPIPVQLANDTILAIVEDRQNGIWISGVKGLYLYQPQTGDFKFFPYPFPFKTGIFYRQALHLRNNGELMLGDREKLILYNPVNSSYRTIALPRPAESNVYLIQTGPGGQDYLANEDVLYRYDDRYGLVPVLNLSDFSIWRPTSLLIDRSSLLWVGFDINGIGQFDLSAPTFEIHANERLVHRAFLEKELGSEIIPFLNLAFPIKRVGPSAAWPDYLFRSAWDERNHRLWVGENNRVAFSDSLGQHWQLIPPIPEFLHITSSGYTGLRGLDVGPDGRVWVADKRSISFFDPVKRQWSNLLNTREKGMDTTLLSFCTAIKADAQKLWIARNDGLLSIDLLTRRINIITQQTRPDLLPADQLIGMEPDPTRPNLLWIGSKQGLICLNKQTMTSQVFTTQQGLPNNTIYAIQTDKAGYLWLSTNQGLCRFHPITHQVRNFTAQNGLPGNEFNTLQYLKLPDGRLGFGGVDGWVAFDPGVIKPDTFQPKIAFTGLKIYNDPVVYYPGSKLLPHPLNEIEKLVLPYDQNTLMFEFAGLQYNQPAGLQYRYRLEGYDDKWVTTDNPVAGYTKLAPGYYTLWINSTNTTGQWSSHVRNLAIRILPPWWLSWWAYTIYIVVLSGIGYALYRNWLQRVRASQQIILQQKETAQLKVVDEMKSRFFSNITHEFRTPLSLILAPLEQMQKRDLPKDVKQELGTVQRNAGQLLQLINQLLDMAKLEASSMKLALYRGNIYKFTGQLVEAFVNAAAAKDVQLHFQSTEIEMSEEFLFDADKLHTILANLLSNAVKFTPAGGTIDVTIEQEQLSEEEQIFRFQVMDSGMGIAPEKLPFIFNRFYQADDSATRSYGGTGIGLALAKELTELMQGTLGVSSELNKGTVFTLSLPLAKATGKPVPVYVPAPTLTEATNLQKAETANDAEMPDTTGKPLVLVTEDNEELRTFIAQTFRQHYRVLTAPNGIEGLKIANEELPDIIVSDWMMPGMDGLTFCQAIRSGNATNHIAFVLLTARAAPVSRIEGLQGEADDYLTKPFVAEELLLRVANILTRQRQLRRYFQQQLIGVGIIEKQPPEATPNHPFLDQLYSIMDTHLDDSEFAGDKLAVEAAVSIRTLNRKLSTLVGLSAGELLKQYRLKKATEFLKQGMGVAETTYLVGYESPAYFSTVFKSVYGVSPSEYGKDKVKL